MQVLKFLLVLKIIVSQDIGDKISLCKKKYLLGLDCEKTLRYSRNEKIGDFTTKYPWSSVLPNKGKAPKLFPLMKL